MRIARGAMRLVGDNAPGDAPAAVAVMRTAPGGAADAADARELVVLAHGLGRLRTSMWMLGRALEAEGFRVLNWGYNSYSGSVEAYGASLADAVQQAVGDAPAVHFVGHSLGCVIIRWVLAHRPPPGARRVVMLAPPNQGARAADRAAPYLGWLLPALAELRTADDATVRALPGLEDVEVGIIAGERDGKVSLAETHLDGMRDRAVVRGGHTFIMHRSDVRALVLAFLRAGTFGAATSAAPALA